jgi:hypothetical protein
MKALTLIAALFLPSGLWAGWSFTATLSQSGPCGANVTSGYNIPSISGMPTKELCESTRAQVLAARSCGAMYASSPPYNYIGDCCVFYTCTACTGFDDAKSGAGTAGGTFSSAGASSGEPFFSTSPNTQNRTWARETEDRIRILGRRNASGGPLVIRAPSTGNRAFDNSYRNLIGLAYSGPGAWRGQRPPTYSAGDERTTFDETASAGRLAGEDEADQAQSLGGVGVHQGAADTPPPPNPEAPKNVNSGECARKGWYFNTKTKNCYASEDQCKKNGGTCRESR